MFCSWLLLNLLLLLCVVLCVCVVVWFGKKGKVEFEVCFILYVGFVFRD